MSEVRLNKYLKDNNICSRRKADEFIALGYIKVNGAVVTELGYKVNPKLDNIEIAPALFQEKAQFRYLLLNKPQGYVCSKSDVEGKTIFELVPAIKDLTYVGRLDKESHGLILLSNDGQFVYAMMGNVFHKEKEYIVTVNKPLTANFIKQQGNGSIRLDNKQVRPARVKMLNEFTYKIIITEGINHQIRRMAENQGYKVVDLKRTRIGNIVDRTLALGAWRDLTLDEIALR